MHLTNTKPLLQDPQPTLSAHVRPDNYKATKNMNDSNFKWAKLTLTTPRTDLLSNSTIFITGTDFKIGRAPTNELVITDQRLSSLHARITYEFDE